MRKILLFFALALLVAASCRKTESNVLNDDDALLYLLQTERVLDTRPFGYKTELPAYLRAVGMENPQIDDDKVALGRALFYDKQLSRDGSVSCASCHRQNRAFSDNVAFSPGIDGQPGHRNAMPLANVSNFASHYSSIAGKHPLLLWDERATTVEEQARIAITNPMEMGMDMPGLVRRLNALDYYPYLVKRAFGDLQFTETRILEGLAAFVGAMGGLDSKFDKSMIQTSGQMTGSLDTIVTAVYYGSSNDTTVVFSLPFFSVSEFQGLRLFVDNCSKCHSPIRPLQEVFVACNGLDMDYADAGLGALTGRSTDAGVFKSPSLRNIALTAPYMHDGRFKTLPEVVEFYSTGVNDHPNLHPDMPRAADGSPRPNWTAQEKANLVAFLNTLTDATITTDPRFSSPFK